MTDKTPKSIRDLERLLRQEFGFSSPRSKAGATEAWKALTNIEVPQTDEQKTATEECRAFANYCHKLSYGTQSSELAAKLQDYADECNQRADELAAEAAAIPTF